MSSLAYFDTLYGERPDYYGLGVRDEFRAFSSSCNMAERTVLDLGCGQGRHSKILAAMGATVDAVDQSRAAICQLDGYATQNGLKITTTCCDALDFRVQPRRYDDIILVTLLDHLTLGGASLLERECRTNIKTGGRVYVEVFTTEDPGFIEAPHRSETGTAVRHFFEKGELANIFKAWKILKCEEFVEEDKSHGPFHLHGIGVLIATKGR